MSAVALLAAGTAIGLERVLGASPNMLVVGVTVGFGGSGAVLTWQRPKLPIGWLFGWINLVFALCAATAAYARLGLAPNPPLPAAGLAAWVQSWLFFLAYPIGFALALLWFPSGRAPSARWARACVGLAAAGTGLLVAAYMFAVGPISGHMSELPPNIYNPAGLVSGDVAGVLTTLAWIVGTFGLVIALVSLLVRFLRAQGRERSQVKVLLGIAAIIVVGLISHLLTEVFLPKGTPDAGLVVEKAAALVGLPAAMAYAILRHRLFDLDLALNRTLVYGGLTAAVAGGYAIAVGVLGALFQTRGSFWISVAAIAALVVVFAPLRSRLQTIVDRVMYGDRDRPYEVVAGLGARIGGAESGETVVAVVVETVARALRLPYASVRLEEDGRDTRTVAWGEPVANQVVISLEHQGERLGDIVFGKRSGGKEFTEAERRLLVDLARQAAAAVHSSRLASDLQHSRQRLVSAREEERRRVRRDLHDGLAPALGGLVLQLGGIRALVRPDPDAAETELARLEHDVQATIAEIRRLVYDLRPPALDDLGLVGAVRQVAEALDAGERGVAVRVHTPSVIPPLPAAVEVAAFRVAQEAMTNAVRHSGGAACLVSLHSNGVLTVDVLDDGVGISAEAKPGVGLASMRERAMELGGTCAVERAEPHGTRVTVRLPLPAARESKAASEVGVPARR